MTSFPSTTLVISPLISPLDIASDDELETKFPFYILRSDFSKFHDRDSTVIDADVPDLSVSDEDERGPFPGTLDEFEQQRQAPYNLAFDQLPLEEWIHLRFCPVYGVHGWFHHSLVRALLLSRLSSTLRFPSDSDIFFAMHLLRWLSLRIHGDVLKYMEPYMIEAANEEWTKRRLLWRTDHGLEFWETRDVPPWPTSAWRQRDRGMMAIFADVLKYSRNEFAWDIEFRGILLDPLQFFPDSQDVLELPLIRDFPPTTAVLGLVFPEIASGTCCCGECERILSQLRHSLRLFGRHYYSMIDNAASQGCNALQNAWEPLLDAAEEWLEEVVGRVESPYTLFPWPSGLRAGPALLELANVLETKIGSHLKTDDLLILIHSLKISCILGYEAEVEYYRPLPPNGLGYVLRVRLSEFGLEHDAEEMPDGRFQSIIFTRGAWLYDLAGPRKSDDYGSITLLYSYERLSIKYCSGDPTKIHSRMMYMPEAKTDYPSRRPLSHMRDRIPLVHRMSSSTSSQDCICHTSIILSNYRSHGFPLWSYEIKDFWSTRALAALIRVTVMGRTIQTHWRPTVHTGTICGHESLHRCATNCSATSVEVISSIETDPLFDNTLQLDYRKQLEEYHRRIDHLRQPGGMMERYCACIVRCGTIDGPVEPIVALAASLGKQIYVIHRQECWDCALSRMVNLSCTVGIALDTKIVTACALCEG